LKRRKNGEFAENTEEKWYADKMLKYMLWSIRKDQVELGQNDVMDPSRFFKWINVVNGER